MFVFEISTAAAIARETTWLWVWVRVRMRFWSWIFCVLILDFASFCYEAGLWELSLQFTSADTAMTSCKSTLPRLKLRQNISQRFSAEGPFKTNRDLRVSVWTTQRSFPNHRRLWEFSDAYWTARSQRLKKWWGFPFSLTKKITNLLRPTLKMATFLVHPLLVPISMSIHENTGYDALSSNPLSFAEHIHVPAVFLSAEFDDSRPQKIPHYGG